MRVSHAECVSWQLCCYHFTTTKFYLLLTFYQSYRPYAFMSWFMRSALATTNALLLRHLSGKRCMCTYRHIGTAILCMNLTRGASVVVKAVNNNVEQSTDTHKARPT